MGSSHDRRWLLVPSVEAAAVTTVAAPANANSGPVPSSPVSKRSVLVGALLALSGTATFASLPALFKSVPSSFSVMELLIYRSFAATLVLAIVCARLPRSSARHTWSRGMLLGALLYTPQLLLFYNAIQSISSGIAVAVGYVYPGLVLILVAIRQRRVPPATHILAAILAFFGILTIVLPGAAGAVPLVPVLMVAFSAVFYAVFVVLAVPLASALLAPQLGLRVLCGISLALLLGGLVTRSVGPPDSPRDLLFAMGLGTAQALALVLGYGGLKRLGAAPTSLLDSTQPVIALLLGAVFLHETVPTSAAFGIAAVLASVALTLIGDPGVDSLRRRRPGQDVSPHSTGTATSRAGDSRDSW